MDDKSAKLVELAQQYAKLQPDPQRNAVVLSAIARELSDLLTGMELERFQSTQGSARAEWPHSFLSC